MDSDRVQPATGHDRYRTLAMALEPVREQAMFVLDSEGAIATWNEGVERLLGWKAQDWIGQPLCVAFTPEDVVAGVPGQELNLANLRGWANDSRWMRRKNGDHFFAVGELTRLHDEQGILVGYLKVLRDASSVHRLNHERDQSLHREELAKREAAAEAAALSAAIEALADGVCITERFAMRRCNQSLLDILGAGSFDDLKVDIMELQQRLRLRPERAGAPLEVHELPLCQALQGHATSMDLWGTHLQDGHDVFMRCAAAPILIEEVVVGTVVVYHDLSEVLQLRQSGQDLCRVATELQERDAELRALTNVVRDYAIFTLNPEGIITSWHLGAQLMKGYSAAEAIGMPFAALFSAEDRVAGLPEYEMRCAASTGAYKGEGRRLRKDGSTFEVAVVLTALRDPAGELLGFLKLTQDITESKRAEREREEMLDAAQRARAEAERASHSKGEFLATLSHELRTPLSAILGWAHVLERGGFDAETLRHGLAAISRNARTQVQLIEDLLDMNRIESGQLRMDLQHIELTQVIAAAVDSALPAAAAKGVGLRSHLNLPTFEIMGDAGRLQQVVGNLLSNAIKFTPTGGRIDVSLRHAGDEYRIMVSDNGQGIEPAFLAHVFDRFQQQDATITRRHGGLGIGLAIVQHLVQLHQGRVDAHSRGRNLGACFIVSLPVSLATAGSAMPAAYRTDRRLEGPEAVRLDGVLVLLVDDETELRDITWRVLSDAGAEVLTARDAKEGLELLRRARPAVLLSDIGMPQVDGYDLMRRVRALPQDEGGQTAAIAFTAYARAEDRQLAAQAGFQLHLAKPVAPQVLVLAVHQLTARTT